MCNVNLKLHLSHCLFKVVDDVVYILNTYRQTDKVWCYACLHKLLVAKLTVSVAGWVQNACTGIGNMSNDADEVEVIHELDGILASALQTEGNNAA